MLEAVFTVVFSIFVHQWRILAPRDLGVDLEAQRTIRTPIPRVCTTTRRRLESNSGRNREQVQATGLPGAFNLMSQIRTLEAELRGTEGKSLATACSTP